MPDDLAQTELKHGVALHAPLRTELPRGVVLKDPLLLASGCCGYGEEYASIVDPAAIGGVITKAVSLHPRDGNKPPRLRETPSGLLNCIGLQNPGVEKFTAEILPRLDAGGFTYIVNVVGETPGEFAAVIERIEEALAVGRDSVPAIMPAATEGGATGMAGYELDLSCPNVESGTIFSTDEAVLRRTVSLCRAATERMLIPKLSPNVTDIVPYARAANEAGGDAVTIANTWNGVSIDIATRRSHLIRPSAGLSGAAIRPATLYQVWRCHRALPGLPIIASGGAVDTASTVEYLLAGATAVQLGTGLYLNPHCPLEIQAGLLAYLEEQGEERIAAIVGSFRDS